MTLSYLVSTAGHSRAYNEKYPHGIRSIIQLIEEGAAEFGDEPVVGFPVLSGSRWTCRNYSFRQLLLLSNGLIRVLRTIGVQPAVLEYTSVIGLLCPSNADFLIAWIALMRLGYGVLLIAPQCSAAAIGSLLRSTHCVNLLYHPKYMEPAVAIEEPGCGVIELPIDSIEEESTRSLPRLSHDGRISHVFHSSGTSGTPKPIAHTHIGSTYILPRRALPQYIGRGASGEPVAEPASFTTTPLFHGGVSDLLRAWMARSVLYLYPTSDAPITTQHLCDAIATCNASHTSTLEERHWRYTVDSFLSVPYILTTLCEDDNGIELLKSMSLVSTGGAPLAKEIGDKMVKDAIRLVSRLGSSECGFLLSSIRDFDNEDDWDWLRNDSPYSDALHFEPIPDRAGLYELVVGTEWASKTKTNREDGSYATGDLYRLHPKRANVWQYAGRGDDVIVMSNGEKVSPGFIEGCIRKCPSLKEAIVVGSDKPSLGLLVFSDSNSVLDDIKPYLDTANKAQPTYAAIYPDMCVVLNERQDYEQIPKASKGTIQRCLTNEVFAAQIGGLWRDDHNSLPRRSKKELEAFLSATVGEIVGRSLRTNVIGKHMDLFSAGIDSLKATVIRSKIAKNVDTGGKTIPLNTVFECSTISALAAYLFDLQEGKTGGGDTEQADLAIMEDWAGKYGTFDPKSNGHINGNHSSARVLLLTGATGSLGSELLRFVQDATIYHKVVCLVRATDDATARKRLEHVMAAKGISHRPHVEARAADLSLPSLGLDDGVFNALLKTELTILHAAWPVHFASGLRSFEDSIKGLRNLLDIVNATHNRQSRTVFCSSLASVLNASPGEVVREKPSTDPLSATSVGYSRSKWVAEQLCLNAHRSGTNVYITRLGQLCGSSVTGQWNETEGWPLLIRTAQTTGSLPLLKDGIAWLPVDVAARSILEIMSTRPESSKPVYHLVHPTPVTWSAILDALEASGLKFDRVAPQDWVKRVENSSDDVVENPSRKMLFLWQRAYGSAPLQTASPTIDTKQAQRAAPTLATLPPLDSKHFEQTIAAWRRSGFLASS